MQWNSHFRFWPFASFATCPRFGRLRGTADIDPHQRRMARWRSTHRDSSAPLMAASRKAHSALVFATGADRADHFRVLVPALVSAVVSATDASVVSQRKANVASRSSGTVLSP